MTTIESTTRMLDKPRARVSLGEDQLAGLAVLARYRGRTLEAYFHGLRCLFQWAADTAWPCWRPPAPTWSCTGLRWKNAAWRHRPSTGVCPPHAGSTVSPT
jgi:hypothetical protein